eukprot:4639806-Prymnesium_polylepis.2
MNSNLEGVALERRVPCLERLAAENDGGELEHEERRLEWVEKEDAHLWGRLLADALLDQLVHPLEQLAVGRVGQQ